MLESLPSLSARGRNLIEKPPFAPYLTAHFERQQSAYHPDRQPDGYIALCVAENRLMWPELSQRLAAVRPAPERVLGYDAMVGAWPFRERLARFLGDRVLQRPVAPEHVSVVAGAGTALEMLFYGIADPGEGVLVPTPSYAGFWPDLETRDGLTLVPVPTRSDNDFTLTTEQLDAAIDASPHRVRALLFTTPDNPLGRVYSKAYIAMVLGWAELRGLHVVFDEVYALSVFGERDFTSVGALRPALADHVHIVWAFSKDFGASGLRCGVLISENEAVRRAVDTLAYWGACSGHTQHLLSETIGDGAWVDDYFGQQRARLADAFGRVAARLNDHGIPFIPAEAGIFVVCDLRRWLADPTPAAEAALWQRVLSETNVNLTPGAACRISEPGFFRLCWASIPTPAVLTGIDRLGDVLRRIAGP